MLRAARLGLLAAILSLACHRETPFVESLRCGMTAADVERMAKERGYDHSDASWLKRSVGTPSKKGKELSLVDLTFRGGRLVAYRQGTWNPRTRTTDYRTVELCH